MKNTTKTIDTLKRALEHAENYISNLGTEPVSAPVELDELRNRLNVGLNESGIEPQQVIDELVVAAEDGLLGLLIAEEWERWSRCLRISGTPWGWTILPYVAERKWIPNGSYSAWCTI